MEAFGIELRDKDRDLKLDKDKRITCGKGGKDWYKFYTFTNPSTGQSNIVGTFGTYRHGGSWQKVDVSWDPLSPEEKAKAAADREAIRAAAAAERQAEIANAMAEAIDVWRQGVAEGASEYLARKGVAGEACRFLKSQLILRWPGRDPGDEDTVVRLPGGTLMLPLVRYDLPRHEALRGLQFIRPDGKKIYLRGFDKPGCALRLGDVDGDTGLLLVCEGYATGLTLRMATAGRALPVYVAFDAGNLAHVVPLLGRLYPTKRILICADDDYLTADRDSGALTNPGRTAARNVARLVAGCDHLWPHFRAATRERGDTDFNDLHVREGLGAVTAQLLGVVEAMVRRYG